MGYTFWAITCILLKTARKSARLAFKPSGRQAVMQAVGIHERVRAGRADRQSDRQAGRQTDIQDPSPVPSTHTQISLAHVSEPWLLILGKHIISVADPGCLSRIPDPDFCPFRIPDLGSKNSNKREGWKKLVVKIFVAFLWPQISQNWKLFYFLNSEEKNWASFQRIIELFTQTFVTKL
jgi:hypothetical protein